MVVLKGYPRLSETFIAQELLGLERAGLDLSHRRAAADRPTRKRHPVHDEIRAPVVYLPEYLHRGAAAGAARPRWPAWPKPGFWQALAAASPPISGATVSRNRIRRFGQALVLAAEWPEGGDLAARPFHPYAGLGDALCQPAARPALDLLGPCQGHLDLARLGACGEACRRPAGR